MISERGESAMRLRGKRWIYQVEGRRLDVENAWSWSMWAQERIIFEGRVVRKTGGYFTNDRSFSLTPYETGLTEHLHVSMFAGFFKVNCQVTLGHQRLTADRVEYGAWRADRGAWPGETACA
jgi:hypothetical protein